MSQNGNWTVLNNWNYFHYVEHSIKRTGYQRKRQMTQNHCHPNPLRFCQQLRVYRTLARQVCPSFQVKTAFMSESDDFALFMLSVSVFANRRSINLICLKYSHSPNRRSSKWTVMDDIIWSILDVHRPNAGLKYPFENTKAGIPGMKSLSV